MSGRLEKVMQSKATQCNAQQSNSRHSKTMQSNGMQYKAMQSTAKQCKRACAQGSRVVHERNLCSHAQVIRQADADRQADRQTNTHTRERETETNLPTELEICKSRCRETVLKHVTSKWRDNMSVGGYICVDLGVESF